MLSPRIDGISQSREGACVQSRRRQIEKGVLGMCGGGKDALEPSFSEEIQARESPACLCNPVSQTREPWIQIRPQLEF